MTTGTTADRSDGASAGDPSEGDPGLHGVVRNSRVMALGTVVSRATGFLRTVVIATAIGLAVGDAYNVANTVPNIIYELLLGGVLTSVVVPLLVQAAERDGDDGSAYAQRLLTLAGVALAASTVVAVLAAPLIVTVYTGHQDPAVYDLTKTFARFFLPQIFFYGIGALIGAILNVRGSFAPPMWTPILNNLVVIATGLMFIVITHGEPQPGGLSTSQTWLLGLGTTLGIVLQTVALLPALRRTGFRIRPRWDFRNAGLGEAARLASWVLLYVLSNQLGYLVIVRLAKAIGVGAFSAYTYAFFLVQLPHAIVAVSVITALLPRMSENAVHGRLHRVSEDLADGLKLAGVLLVPSQLLAMALGPLVGVVVFNYVNLNQSGARLIGYVLAGYAVSLVPFSAYQLQLRAFYAMRDTRTPALVNLAVNGVNVAVDLALFWTLHGVRARVVGLAVGYSVSYLVGFLIFQVLLRRRLEPARQRTYLLRTYVRLTIAGALSTTVGWLVAHALTGVLGQGRIGSGAGLALGVLVAVPIYVVAALRMRVREVRQVFGMARTRLG